MNMGLIRGIDAQWFRRVGMTIANGDEVGVLTPQDLEPESDVDVEELRRVIRCLLKAVPEPEVTLNEAGKRLAYGGDPQWEKYRSVSKDGCQRLNKTLRIKIEKACQRGIRIVGGGYSWGFKLAQKKGTAVLRRTETPATVDDVAGQGTDF